MPILVIDQTEQEVNEYVTKERLTAHFNAVLNAAQHLAEPHANIPPDDLAGYALLHNGLNN